MFKKFNIFAFIITAAAVLPFAYAAAATNVTDEATLNTALADTSVTEIDVQSDLNITAAHTIDRELVLKSVPPAGSTATQFTLTGNGTTPLLNITAPKVTITDLGFKSGMAAVSSDTARGGAININITTPPASPSLISTTTISGSDFENNISSVTANGDATSQGGAIYINDSYDVIISSSTFKTNISTATSTGGTATANGGAIYNAGSGNVQINNSDFEQNSAGNGGAIYNTGDGLSLKSSTFSKNTATNGGALYSTGKITATGLSFTENTAAQNGGAVYIDSSDAKISNSSFTSNSAVNGGALYNNYVATLSKTVFSSNTATGNGGAIYNANGLESENYFTATYNSAVNGGALYNKGTADFVKATFKNNTASGNGGAIYTDGEYDGTIYIIGGADFNNNTATGGRGGAIYADGRVLVSLMSLSGINFTGNTDSTGANAIYMQNGAVLNLNAVDSSINFYDPIASDNTTEININGTYAENPDISPIMLQGTNSVNFYTDIPDYKGALNIYGGTIGAFADMTFNTSSFTMTNANFNMVNNAINSLTIASPYTQTGKLGLSIDMDLRTGTSDTIEATGTMSGTSKTLDVKQINILKDSSTASTAPITVSSSFDIVFDTAEKYYGPIFEYALSQPDSHTVVATKTNHFTPLVLAAPIAQNTAMMSNVAISDSLLNRLGVMLSKDGRFYNAKDSYNFSNYDAAGQRKSYVTQDITQKDYYATWFVPYGAQQKTDFANDLNDVKNNAYGANAGVDMPVISIGDDIGIIPTVFAGYGGSRQTYEDLTSTKDSIVGGLMATLYVPYFYISAEGHVTSGKQISTFRQYRDTFDIFTASSSAKAELMLPLFWGFTLQPYVAAFYNFVNTQNYQTQIGAPITPENYTNVQVTPGIKLAADIASWRPYASYAYAHNAYNDAKINIEDFTLPEFKPKDYAEYSFGLQNTFFDTYSGYVQYTGYADGMSGYALQMGLRGYLDF